MEIQERIEGDVVVLEPRGNLMDGNETNALSEKISSLDQDGFTKVVLAMREVSMVSSMGVGTLLSSVKKLREVNGDLRLSDLPERVHHLLVEVTQIGANFQIFETADQAVASFLSE